MVTVTTMTCAHQSVLAVRWRQKCWREHDVDAIYSTAGVDCSHYKLTVLTYRVEVSVSTSRSRDVPTSRLGLVSRKIVNAYSDISEMTISQKSIKMVTELVQLEKSNISVKILLQKYHGCAQAWARGGTCPPLTIPPPPLETL